MAVSPSPSKKSKLLLAHRKPQQAKKQLTFHYAIMKTMNQYINRTSTSSQSKKVVRDMLMGSVMRKYKLINHVASALHLSPRRERKTKKLVNPIANVRDGVRRFFERDDVSRITTGVKQTLTLNKVKKQKRLLTDSLQNLHYKYNAELQGHVSYSLFCRLRPFYVVPASEVDRSTCLCRTHENIQFLANSLLKAKLLETTDIESLISDMVSDMVYIIKDIYIMNVQHADTRTLSF